LHKRKEDVMRKVAVIGLVIALSMLLAASIVFAMHGGEHGLPWSDWQGSGGWGMGQRYQQMYNPDVVETVSGTVQSVEKITPMEGMSTGVHVLLKTEDETVDIHLGPAWYISRLDTKIVKGDKIEVKGSRVTMRGKPTIIASEIKKGESVLILRDENGIPAWSGWRREREHE
jgi:hypothetical protein